MDIPSNNYVEEFVKYNSHQYFEHLLKENQSTKYRIICNSQYISSSTEEQTSEDIHDTNDINKINYDNINNNQYDNDNNDDNNLNVNKKRESSSSKLIRYIIYYRK
ncbi:hypothetical protein BCR36DRAFT_410968 [Piromyces finnis]|uniref:Uncharacterized protein n=1 Tax=Piromyces finnis TaxID=1754191 RepID=A0A1Y1VF06_9FUNG|nr:hypothetical protein BCR36DRAFT_410968 [Piromyces finnis]|eukprot:ORX53813.1 hypothetical protein BCR36DRAFT_410968 [Piromyces finnis]